MAKAKTPVVSLGGFIRPLDCVHRALAWSAILGLPTLCVAVWSERSIQLGLSVWAVPIALLWLFVSTVIVAWTEVLIEQRAADRYRTRTVRRPGSGSDHGPLGQ